MQKAKEMYQRKVRFPEDVRQAIEKSGYEQCRHFNTEMIYQLRKAYGLTGEKKCTCLKAAKPGSAGTPTGPLSRITA